MRKSLIVTSLLAFIATSVFAIEAKNGTFISLEVGSTSYDVKVEYKTFPFSYTLSESGGSQALKAGKYLGEVGRVYATIGRVNAEDSILNYGLGYDYLIYNSSDFTPFLGATLGYQQVDIDNTSLNLSGLTYGLELGVDYSINKNFDIELGYRMNFNSNSDAITTSYGSVELTIENTKMWYIGANYNF
ncbi:hypothetical protein [Sulfurimonas sp.]|uniref:hypothetical protein n=1 Tax=Sulfurimonas sp. TaxID=2022749 RepID=UPI002B48666B|nr:hypothetical protein [Sulfurimonas sp.]